MRFWPCCKKQKSGIIKYRKLAPSHMGTYDVKQTQIRVKFKDGRTFVFTIYGDVMQQRTCHYVTIKEKYSGHILAIKDAEVQHPIVVTSDEEALNIIANRYGALFTFVDFPGKDGTKSVYGEPISYKILNTTSKWINFQIHQTKPETYVPGDQV